jgi:site-specific recombinase XerD
MFLTSLHAAFQWAAKPGVRIITTNPIAGIEKPVSRNRSRECLVTPEQPQRILAVCRMLTLRNAIAALENTGARPREIIAATAADWDDQLGAIVYHREATRREGAFKHKTTAHKDRVIYFSGEALVMVRQLVQKHPMGPLFRTGRGSKYSEQSLCVCFQHLRDWLGLPGLIPYSYGHSLATRWLMAGKSVDILAELLRNTPETIRRHYSHLCSDRAGIRCHLDEFRREGENGTPTP